MWRPQTKSLFSYTLMFVIPLGTAALVMIWLLNDNLLMSSVKDEINRRINDTAKHQAIRLDAKLAASREFAKTLASYELLLNGLSDGERQVPYLSEFFKSLRISGSPNARITLVDSHGHAIVSNSEQPTVGFPLKELTSGLFSSSMGVRLVEPVYSANVVKGAVVIEYDAVEFAQLLDIANADDEFFALSAHNRVLYSSAPSLIAPGNRDADVQQDGWLKGSYPLSFQGVTLIFSASAEREFKALKSIRTLEVSIFVAWLVIMIVLIVGVMKLASRRVKRFSNDVVSVNGLTCESQKLLVDTPQEMGQLAAVVNQMQDQLNQASEKEKALRRELCKAQKLESIGQLARGIAHEINTPCHYINDNLNFLVEAQQKLIVIVKEFLTLNEIPSGSRRFRDQQKRLDVLMQQYCLDYLLKEIPAASKESLIGIGEVSRIVEAMNEISYPGTSEKSVVDLNSVLQNGITVSRSLWKYVAKVVTDFDPNLPHVACFPEQVNQVFVNIIINAAHAIEQTGDSANPGLINVSTRAEGDQVLIRIADNGCGIAVLIREQVFSPFFTTKEFGKGTGQGLAIARDIIVNKHGGKLYFDAQPDRGTIFTIELPLQAPNYCSVKEAVRSGNSSGYEGRV